MPENKHFRTECMKFYGSRQGLCVTVGFYYRYYALDFDMPANVPPNEAERLAALRRYRILDTEAEEAFDRITRLAQKIFRVPIALITLIDVSRQWFKSCYGLGMQETGRDVAFCSHAILRPEVMVVSDATTDPRFAENPFVVGEPNIRFYAGAPLRSPDGHNVGTLCILDTDPRWGLNEEQRLILEDLAALVVDEMELRLGASQVKTDLQVREQAARVAEAANRSKSEFLSRMSHELRTPLTAILGFGQLLEASDLSESDQEAVEYIVKAGNHLMGLINDVLDFSRIESGKLLLSMEPVAISDLLKEVISLMQGFANERRIQLSREVPLGCGFVQADMQRLKQVLLNLISNAIKYNQVGGRVSFSCDRPREGTVRLGVHDTGSGIPAELQLRLFQPFDRLGAERTSVEGTGLGLALSKQLVEAMDGALTLESNSGQGSTFWIELTDAQEQLVGEPEIEAEIEPPEGTRNYTILYIEDNLSNIKLVERVLGYRSDIRLLTAMQGRLGLELALLHLPDLILLDLHLPELEGKEVLRELRLNPRSKEIPVVVLSADATPKQIRRVLDAGANTYLTKPFDIPKFRQTVDVFLADAGE
jgi:signal transduction histidine kinase